MKGKGAPVEESLNPRGYVTLQLTDRRGRVVYRDQRANRIVKSGRRLVAELFGGIASGTPPTRVTHMAVGSDGTPPNDDQTSLPYCLKEESYRGRGYCLRRHLTG